MSDQVGTPVLVPGVEGVERRSSAAFGCGAVIGALGGLIGLGGAEFRPRELPVFIPSRARGAVLAVSDQCDELGLAAVDYWAGWMPDCGVFTVAGPH